MQTDTWDIPVIAMTPIAHASAEGAKSGNIVPLNLHEYVQADGVSVAQVPIISGNSIRGILRDHAAHHLCTLLEAPLPTLRAFHFLFSGGGLTEPGQTVDISFANRLRTLLPIVSVFGGSRSNTAYGGKVLVHDMRPACQETAHLLPDNMRRASLPTSDDLIDVYTSTTRDDREHPQYRTYRGPDTMETDASPQMIYSREAIKPGTLLHWKIVMCDLTDLEYQAWMSTLGHFAARPYIGGRSASGFGEIRIDWPGVNPMDVDVQSYNAHIRDNRDAIMDILERL